jgi:ankyrin repeat protein
MTLVSLEDVRDEVLEYLPLLRDVVSHPSVEGKVAFDVAVRFGLKDKFAELKEVVMAGWDENEFRFHLENVDEHSCIWIARQLVGDTRYPLDINGQMCLAARMKHEGWLRELSTMKGADPLTLLRAASRCGSLDLISHALTFVRADDINKTESPHGIGPNLDGSALELARGEPEIVRLLCASDKIDKSLALVVACELGLADLCNSLLERGAPIQGYAATNLDSESGRCTPLTAAAAYGRTEIVEMLLKNDAYVNFGNCHAMERLCSGAGLRCVIDQAPTTIDGLADSLRLLLKAGAVTDVCRSENCSGDDESKWDSEKLSAAESVCQRGLVALIKVFVDECGIDVNELLGVDPGYSLLEAACLSPTSTSHYGQVEVVLFLRARGAEVSQKLLNETTSSLLHHALTDVLKPAEVALELVVAAVDDLERRLAVARDAEREVKAAVSVLQFAEGTMRRSDKRKHLKTAIRMCTTAETARRSPLIFLRTQCES